MNVKVVKILLKPFYFDYILVEADLIKRIERKTTIETVVI